ncbi:lamin tail domain-containing protein [Tessaracoccus lubricantis]|uniref:lamin tail domain-containing protein n=1 Tax=Tessaracoccus lubricantis TaxID=545543 RepID=UPI003636889B
MRKTLVALLTAVSLVVTVFATLASPARAAQVPAILVTEIGADHASYDHFEFFELTNTTAEPVSLAGYQFAYTYADSADTSRDVVLTVDDAAIPAGGTAAVWLQYTATNVDSFSKTDEQFRAQWGDAASTYQLLKATGQAGMANGGDRGIRVTAPDGGVNWSFYPAGSVSTTKTAHFGVSSAQSQRYLFSDAGTPGSVTAAQLTEPTPEPSPSPSAEPTATAEPSVTAEPSPEPSVSAEPTTSPQPTVDPSPSGDTPPLVITELLPDSSNVNGADGYEFIEVHNTTDQPIDFVDFKVNYLYPNADLTIGNTALWPSVPESVVIPGGGTLVFWIKNAGNAHLGIDAFNLKWGTSLVGGEGIVEITSGGMANSGIRGVDIITNTGVTISRALYNVDGIDHTVADQGIQYGPGTDATRQLTGLAAATPGVTSAGQVPGTLTPVTPDPQAPSVTDRTAAVIPQGADFPITHIATDDRLVRTVTLHLKSNVDAGVTEYNLLVGADDTYTFTIPAADLTGKRYFDYWLTATDGTHTTSTASRRIVLDGVNTDPVRLNLTDGQFVGGATQVVAATEGPIAGLTLDVAGTDVTSSLTPALEGKPVFVFDVTSVNAYFQNGVLVDGEVLRIFDDNVQGYWDTISVPVDEKYLTQGEPLTVGIWAGTKKAPEIDLNENNDDFEVRDVRLVLPDGRTLRPADFVNSSTILRLGDSTGKLDFYDAVFTVPADAFSALGHTWDTTTLADGRYPVTAAQGEVSLTRTVTVDNTAPVITTSLGEGTQVKGDFALMASAADAGVGGGTLTARLDGEPVALPYESSSLTMAPGSHVFEVTATDALGNRATKSVTFRTPAEHPAIELLTPADGAEVPATGVELSARITDPTRDLQDGSFNRGFTLTAADDDIALTGGTTTDSSATDREAAPAELGTAITSETLLPYQLATVDVPAAAGADYRARLTWAGEVNAGSRVSMSVQRTDGTWDRVADTVADGAAELTAIVPAEGHAVDGTLTVLIQHTDGWAGGNATERGAEVTKYHADAVDRSAYDFTIAHMSDTQYYNANADYHRHQVGINDFLLAERDNLNLQYVVHTGDIVDNNEIPVQWERANPQYRKFDDAALPYGVLAGNHDVSQAANDYTEYSQHFGAARFEDNPWYGGSHLDNRGHYDLISAGGIDFLHLYMGWGAGDEQIEWLNQVLRAHPERIAVLNLHEYMLTTGGLGAIPQRIFDEVIAVNPNVRMVQSGHYHDAFTRLDAFDDDGDGVDDRTVVSMLFDYQGLPEGGQGFVRLQHFDNVGRQLLVRTYSPTLQQFNGDDATLEPEHQSFEISYDTLGISPATKSLTTTALTADILTSQVIGSFTDAESGSTVTATWAEPGADGAGWYVVTRDDFGGEAISEVRFVVPVTGGVTSPEPSVSPEPTKSPEPTVAPSQSVTAAPGFVRTAPYTKPGVHRNLGGRDWNTTCEPYSQTERCRTEIWATVVKVVDGQFVRTTGWAFNNLTYLPLMKREAWAGNPLGAAGEFTSGGRQWRTECDTAATGRGACRSYTMTTVYSATPKADGGYAFGQRNQWVFNNLVLFRTN